MTTFTSTTAPIFFSQSLGREVSAADVNYFHAANAAIKSGSLQLRSAMRSYLTYIVKNEVPAADRKQLRKLIAKI